MYVKCNDLGKIEVYPQGSDKCYECFNADSCPLIAALQGEVVIQRYGEIQIQECGLFISEQEVEETMLKFLSKEDLE